MPQFKGITVRNMIWFAAALAAVTTSAQAQKAPTPVDLTDPATVAKLVQDLGYKAELKARDNGEPYINSAANGSNFSIEFYGCEKAVKCTSIQFFAWYKKEPWYNAALTDKWNAKKRFVKAAIDKDGDFSTYMDITALGGTRESFADSLDWWTVLSSDLFEFFEEEDPARAKGATPAK
ncbi:YbjN domain-containing protein [Sphingomonas koreensis]|jgi:hypothetical protein|nr:YbjN domain-containing protein [Sphingomonas koreensis]APR53612.1 hypothetical protein BRX40_15345 [Sphingomonas koreensis]